MGLIGAVVVAAPVAALAQPADLYAERVAIGAVGERCRLFTPGVSAALAAGAAQARGAALRAGSDPRSLSMVAQDARARVAGLDCRSSQVTTTAARVQGAFAGYERTTRMTYRGELAAWSADREVGRAARWRLAQTSSFGGGQMIFGLAGRQGAGALVAVADFADDATPYGARLVLRDGSRTMGPYLLASGPSQPLSRKLPPRAATRTFMAEARAAAEAELLPKGAEGGWAFRFPTEAVQALAELDPREAVAVEFLFAGDRVRTAYVEVGDFAAAKAFVQMASR
jgi:hypothetical protein